jgi:hypothetical protein
MDETPLVCGSGHNPGGCGGVTGRADAFRQVPQGRGDARRRGSRGEEHQENAGNVHVQRCPEETVAEECLQP